MDCKLMEAAETMIAFTPGPWHVETGDSVVRIHSSAGEIAATSTKPYYQKHDEVDLANARLMADAPDMRAALERIRSADPRIVNAAWENWPSPYETDTEDAGAIKRLLEAIVTASLGAEGG